MAWKEETLQRKSQEFAAIASEYNPLNFDGLEEKLYDLEDNKAMLETTLKAINQRITVLETIFAERFAEQDIKTMNFNSGRRLSVRFKRPLITVDKPAFIEWLKTSGLESELTVYDQRLKGISKGVLEETGKLPPGIAEGEPVPVVSYTKSK